MQHTAFTNTSQAMCGFKTLKLTTYAIKVLNPIVKSTRARFSGILLEVDTGPARSMIIILRV